MRGLFITFEGIEGSGKSSQLNLLTRRLRRMGWKVIQTREPGGTRFGNQIRRALLSVQNQGLDPRAELFLYLASRTQHLEEVILPALKKGSVVLCDRFSDATLAYQGFGRRLDMKTVRAAVDYAAKGVRPDLTLLLDLDVRAGLSRVHIRGRADRLDREDVRFHQRVRNGYLRLARSNPRRIRVIDAARERNAVSRDIMEILGGFLPARGRRVHVP